MFFFSVENSHFFFSRGEEGPFHLHFLCVAEQTKTRDKVSTRFLFPFFTRTEVKIFIPEFAGSRLHLLPLPFHVPLPCPSPWNSPLTILREALCIMLTDMKYRLSDHPLHLYTELYTLRYSILNSVTQLEVEKFPAQCIQALRNYKLDSKISKKSYLGNPRGFSKWPGSPLNWNCS